MSSINLQTPIIYPSVVFFSISIVTIKRLCRADRRVGESKWLGREGGHNQKCPNLLRYKQFSLS